MPPYIYPAHAGINLMLLGMSKGGYHLPRTHGDKPIRPTGVSPSLTSTPHTRG